MWITTTTGNYFYDHRTDGEVPVIGQDWILPSGDNLGRVQSIGGVPSYTERARLLETDEENHNE